MSSSYDNSFNESDSSFDELNEKSLSSPKNYDGPKQVFTEGEAQKEKHLNVPKSNLELKETTYLESVSTIDPSLPSSSKSTTSELSDVIAKPSTSKSDFNLVYPQPSSDSQSSQKCILAKQVATEAPTDSINKSNRSDDAKKNIKAKKRTHSAIHTHDVITNPTLSDNQAMESSSVHCSDLIIRMFVTLFLFSIFFYSFMFFPHSGVSLIDKIKQKLEHIDISFVANLEKPTLNHDEIIRKLTEYVQQDEPLVKVLLHVRDDTVDTLNTVDIIRKNFARGSDNGNVSLYPSFIIIDNLKLENFNVVINFVKMYREIYPRDQQGIILADFIIDDNSIGINLEKDVDILYNTFTKANINFKLLFSKP